MTARTGQQVRCAIYTRKSTEHGLELEFNSLDAQREACEAYIKSQLHEGWNALSQRYDDPAYSGGSLERPALQQLLTDIDAGRVNVVVVYKIDRLTRSLADFAKLVEIFDKKGISFVAVTQQFNTTTSMGRLTLNVLLSFAQFERELSSERVRDKIAASRRKGKWTGGSIPLGYDVTDKKLVINPTEAETVRYIFKRYLELGCLRLLRHDLDSRGIVSKRRTTKGGQVGGRKITYGPLAYLLKSRTYIGEMGHKDKWFPGEHAPIIDVAVYDQVQELMKTNSVTLRQKRSSGDALLTGLLYDDRGNRMTPSFSTKRGVRYRFYVSAALIAGRRNEAGSQPRVSAPDLERSVVSATRKRFVHLTDVTDQVLISGHVDRIVIGKSTLTISLTSNDTGDSSLEIAWSKASASPNARIEIDKCELIREPDIRLVHAIGRAHSWLRALSDGKYQSIEELAGASDSHPKVIRKLLRLAFLAPDITEAIVLGRQPKSLSVSDLEGISALSWCEQRDLIQFPISA